MPTCAASGTPRRAPPTHPTTRTPPTSPSPKGLLFPNVGHKCLMAKDGKRKKVYASGGSSWILDSGCTNHMTGEKKMFSSYEKNQDPQRAITFGDGNQGLVKGLGKIAISPDHSISNVFLVDSLDYNLLSVSQLCQMGYNCLFTDVGVTVFRRSDDSIALDRKSVV